MMLSGSTIRELNIVGHYSMKRLNGASYDLSLKGSVVLWPKRMTLVTVIEYLRMPLAVVGVVHDKSSWVRRGVTVANTMVQPGWRGFLTLELVNHGWLPIRLPASCAVAQVAFHHLDREAVPYQGRYQDQENRPVAAR